MRLNNRKIDLLLKLLFYMFPLVYILICAIAMQSPTEVSFLTQLTIWFDGLVGEDTIFNGFFEWFVINISRSNGVIMCMYYAIYIIFVEFVLLFKNCMVWLFRFAENLLERGVGSD